MHNAWNMRQNQRVVYTAVIAVIYSASHVDRAFMDCFVDVHAMGAWPNRWISPVVDLRSASSPTKSASE